MLKISLISRENNSRILRIKNAKFTEYSFYTYTDIYGDSQICIGVPLIEYIRRNISIESSHTKYDGENVFHRENLS